MVGDWVKDLKKWVTSFMDSPTLKIFLQRIFFTLHYYFFKGFFQEQNLHRHIASHKPSNGIGFKCSQCPATFNTKNPLAQHMKENHTKRGGGVPLAPLVPSSTKSQKSPAPTIVRSPSSTNTPTG